MALSFQASRILETARHSLAFLLHHYCAVDTNKKYQMADWRMRPLPEELLAYARTDTHFLLFIKAKMKNQLIEKVVAMIRQTLNG
jgi:exosome complex exonuclease RRP6